MKMRKQFSGKHYFKGVKMDQTSVTVPDQSLSIRDLLERHSRGLPLDAPQLKGEYFDTEVPRFEDLTDAVKYKEDLMDRQKELEQTLKKQRASKRVPPGPSPKGETVSDAATSPSNAQTTKEIISGTE